MNKEKVVTKIEFEALFLLCLIRMITKNLTDKEKETLKEVLVNEKTN